MDYGYIDFSLYIIPIFLQSLVVYAQYAVSMTYVYAMSLPKN